MTAGLLRTGQPSAGGVVRHGALAGVVAAVSTTTVAVVAQAAGADLVIDGEAIPAPAFAMWTLLGAALGIVLARGLRARRRFLQVAVAATALSLIPAIAAPDDVATSLVLIGAHLLAAAIIVPTLSRRLPPAR